MKTSYFAAVLSLICVLGFGGSANAAQNNSHSVEIFDAVQIGSTRLKPGNYKVEWPGTGGGGEFSAEWEDCGHSARDVEDE
jgi:hypothetical protein